MTWKHWFEPDRKKHMPTEEDVAKIAYAKIILAIEELRNDMTDNEHTIHLPSSLSVNKSTYVFSEITQYQLTDAISK